MEETQFPHKQTLPLHDVAAGSQPRPPRAASESGYALLLVFLMAALIAIALYKELPRSAFEAQRAREQLLIERGEQYKRAIQLFVRKAGRYPATMEELESLNHTRFLRKRYLDPMTGKEKWRLIHVNGGVLTDSIIPKNKPGQDQQQANTNTFIGEGPVMGGANNPSPQQINMAMRRRASDDRPVVTQELPDPPDPEDQVQESPTAADSNTGQPVGAPGTPGANQQTPGAPPPGGVPQPGAGGYPGQPGYNPATGNPPYGTPGALPGQSASGNGGSPNNGGQSSGSSVYASGSSVYVAPALGQPPPPLPPGVTGLPGHGDVLGGMEMSHLRAQAPPAPGSVLFNSGDDSTGPAAQTANAGFGGSSPGPTGSSGLPSSPGLPGIGGTQVGGGIAGVASESTGPAIKVYNERKKYNEWEFVYDQSKDRGLVGVQRNGGVPGTTAQSLGSIPGQQPGAGGPAGSSGGFGGQAGNPGSNGVFGGSSGFGQPTPQQSQSQPQQPAN